MRNLQFKGWQRVSKAYFQRAYLSGEKVCVAPCNVNLDSPWYGGQAFMPRLYNDFVMEYYHYSPLYHSSKLNKIDLNNYVLSEIEKWLNEVKIYNCNRELGTYLAYYVAR